MTADRIREVRRRLREDGPPRTRDHEGDFARVAIPDDFADEIRDLLIAERAGVVVEVGLAYGSSALAIGEALVTVGTPAPQHLIIDPFQDQAFTDVGWELLGDAGLHGIARLIREFSSLALPGLLDDGLVADAAFVDGSHRFHEVFVDLYFLRKIVRPGGLLLMDDGHKPPVRTAVRYFEENLGWAVLPDAFVAGKHRGLAIRLPDTLTEPSFEDFRPF